MLVFMLSVFMSNIVLLSVLMLSVVGQSVVVPNVVAPTKRQVHRLRIFFSIKSEEDGLHLGRQSRKTFLSSSLTNKLDCFSLSRFYPYSNICGQGPGVIFTTLYFLYNL